MNPGHPPVQGRSPIRRIIPAGRWIGFLLVAGALTAGVLLYLHRPEGQFFFPRCSFHAATGLWCPGCGGLRATHDLLHGRLVPALHNNLLLVLALPGLALMGLWTLWRSRTANDGESGARGCRPTFQVGSSTVWIVFGLLIVFTLLRNLPWPPFLWLAPLP